MFAITGIKRFTNKVDFQKSLNSRRLFTRVMQKLFSLSHRITNLFFSLFKEVWSRLHIQFFQESIFVLKVQLYCNRTIVLFVYLLMVM